MGKKKNKNKQMKSSATRENLEEIGEDLMEVANDAGHEIAADVKKGLKKTGKKVSKTLKKASATIDKMSD